MMPLVRRLVAHRSVRIGDDEESQIRRSREGVNGRKVGNFAGSSVTQHTRPGRKSHADTQM